MHVRGNYVLAPASLAHNRLVRMFMMLLGVKLNLAGVHLEVDAVGSAPLSSFNEIFHEL
jgi:hypothetical protein